eukprot:4378767-Amphidinium_carterae.1
MRCLLANGSICIPPLWSLDLRHAVMKGLQVSRAHDAWRNLEGPVVEVGCVVCTSQKEAANKLEACKALC